MNCPKCGGELIINSDVCPNCDVAGEEAPIEEKKSKPAFLKNTINYLF